MHRIHFDWVNNQTYSPTKNGDYAVEVRQHGCVAESDCFKVLHVAIDAIENRNITLSPNPTSGLILLDFERVTSKVLVKVKEATGKIISEQLFHSEKSVVIKIEGGPGMYFVEIQQEGYAPIIQKIIKY